MNTCTRIGCLRQRKWLSDYARSEYCSPECYDADNPDPFAAFASGPDERGVVPVRSDRTLAGQP